MKGNQPRINAKYTNHFWLLFVFIRAIPRLMFVDLGQSAEICGDILLPNAEC
jgi:hypothetical protein